jgi:hypothetical protein
MITALFNLPSLPVYDQLQVHPLRLTSWRGDTFKDARLDVREGD